MAWPIPSELNNWTPPRDPVSRISSFPDYSAFAEHTPLPAGVNAGEHRLQRHHLVVSSA
jgi:hypothetical protein